MEFFAGLIEMPKISHCLLFALLCCASSIEAQQPLVGSITGTTRDGAKTPIARVALTAVNLDSGTNRFGASDNNGIWQFVDLPPGRYSIAAQKKGYLDSKVDLVSVAPGQKVEKIDITMAPARH
jgi:hypothetical protein